MDGCKKFGAQMSARTDHSGRRDSMASKREAGWYAETA